MDSIYSNASFTIVAADSEHADHGIHGVSLERQQPLTCTDTQPNVSLGIRSVLSLLQDTKWGGRAWTFQEALCSRKMLVFTKYMCSLVCPRAVQREDKWEEAPNVSAPNHPLSPDFALIKVQPVYGWNRGQYTDFVSIYTARSLTNAGDIINAFTGAMNRAKQWWGDFWYGLPRNAFLYALSWTNHPVNHGVFVTLDDPLLRNRHPVARREGFPSWSWAGWIHPVGCDIIFTATTTRKTVPMYGTTNSKQMILVNDPTLPLGSNTLKVGDRDLLHFPNNDEWILHAGRTLKGMGIPLEPILLFRTTVFRVIVSRETRIPETGGWGIYQIDPFEDTQLCHPLVAKTQLAFAHLRAEWRASQPDELDFALLGVANVSSASLQQPFKLTTIILATEGEVSYRAGMVELYLETFEGEDAEEILANFASHSSIETIALG